MEHFVSAAGPRQIRPPLQPQHLGAIVVHHAQVGKHRPNLAALPHGLVDEGELALVEDRLVGLQSSHLSHTNSHGFHGSRRRQLPLELALAESLCSANANRCGDGKTDRGPSVTTSGLAAVHHDPRRHHRAGIAAQRDKNLLRRPCSSAGADERPWQGATEQQR